MAHFELVERLAPNAVIKVIGVGGGGGNAVAHMVNAGVDGVEFITANTDSQAIKQSGAKSQLQLGANVTTYTDTPSRGTWRYRIAAVNAAAVSAELQTAEAELAGDLSHRLGLHGSGPELGEHAFVFLREEMEEALGDDQVDDAITEELKALIVLAGDLALVGHAGESQGGEQEAATLELIAEAHLQRIHRG